MENHVIRIYRRNAMRVPTCGLVETPHAGELFRLQIAMSSGTSSSTMGPLQTSRIRRPALEAIPIPSLAHDVQLKKETFHASL
jgi:hypothetical protein